MTWFGSVPNGLVVYGSVCFIGVIVFTATLVVYYARPKLPPTISILTFLAWLCTFVICFLVPIDLIPGADDTLDTVWSVLFWCSFLLMWLIIPLASGYYDNGAFTFKTKMKISLRTNGILFAIAGVIGVLGVIYLKAVQAMNWNDLSGLVIAASNTWGLVILVIMAGYGLIEFPRSMWYKSDLTRTKAEVCYHASSIYEEVDATRDEFHHMLAFLYLYEDRVINTNDATLQQYFRDILNEVREKEVELSNMQRRAGPYDEEALVVLKELKKDDTPVNEVNLIKLNYFVKNTVRHLILMEAQWRDTIKEYVDLDAAIGTEGLGIRSPVGSGFWGSLVWCVRIRFIRRIMRVAAFFSAILTVLLIWMEFTLPFGFNLSPLGAIICSDAVRNNPLALQLFSVIPITYLSASTYFPLFNVRISKFYCIGAHRTGEDTLLFNAKMALRCATPLAYNFQLLLKLDSTALIKFIGVTKVVPFFGGSFTSIFPWFIFIFALCTLLNVWGVLARMLNIQRFQYVILPQPGDEQHQDMCDSIADGEKLIKFHILNDQNQTGIATVV